MNKLTVSLAHRLFPDIGKIRHGFSNLWKNRAAGFQSLEAPALQTRNAGVPPADPRKSGVALIVVMWVLVVVSLIVVSFAFEMKLEARIISMQRKRFKADQLALSGIELAKAMFAFEADATEGDDVIYEDPWLEQASKIDEGVPATVIEELGGGTITLNIDFEKGGRNLSKLSDDEWQELFEQSGVPAADRDELLGCLKDWQDENDLHELNGAESDDEFYKDRGYECKNAPLDTIDELLMIKGWTEEIVYGTATNELEDAEYPMTGLAQYLTLWGDGRINPNSASREVLASMYLSEDMIEAILEMRMGPDGEPGTEDDGLTQEDFTALGLDSEKFTLTPEFAKVTVEGEMGGLVSRIYAVFKLGEAEPTPLFWQEGMMEK
jgi:general secretion pathway protein K